MKKILIGILIGIVLTNIFSIFLEWSILISPTILKAGFAVFLALIGGLIALYQVKANVISSARIKWIEDFKSNVAQYSSITNSSIFHFREFDDPQNGDSRRQYHQQYMDDVQKAMSIKGKIFMNLNRNEPNYEKIYQIVNDIENLTSHVNLKEICKVENYSKLELKFDELNVATHQAMKAEWEKAKKMFYIRWLEK